jgi:hypothetical protein
LSLKIMVCRPASTASTASAKANCPGVEINATVASPPRAAARTVTGGGADPKLATRGEAAAVSAASTSAMAAANASSSSASRATSISLGTGLSGRSNPMDSASSRLSSVAIATSAPVTPGRPDTRRLTCIRDTEST